MSNKQTAYKVARYLGWSLLTLLLLITVLVGSHWGNRLLIEAVQQIEPAIDIKLSQGSLFNDPVLSDMSIKLAAIELKATTLKINWDWRCLRNGGICIDDITLDNLTINVAPATSQPQSKPQQPVTKIDLPLWFKLNNLAINQLKLTVSGHQISWQQLQLALAFSDSSLTVNDFNLVGLTAKLAPAKNAVKVSTAKTSNPSTKAVTSDSNKALELPEITLPLAIVINRLAIIDTTIINGNKVEKIARLALNANAEQQRLTIEKLTLEHALAKINLEGAVSLTNSYPLKFTSIIKTEPALELGENTININLNGSLNKLNTKLASQGQFTTDINATLDLLQPHLPFDLAANWLAFTVPNQPIKVEPGQLNASGSLQQLTFSVATGMVGDQIPAATISAQGIASQVGLTLNSLKINTLNGQINSNANLKWHNGLSWQAKLNLTNIEPDKKWPAIKAKLNGDFHSIGQLNGEKWQVALDKINLNGHWQNNPLELSGKINGHSVNSADNTAKKSPYGKWQLQQLRLKNGSNSLLVNGSIDQTIAIKAKINADDLSQSVPQITGSLLANLALSGSTISPTIKVALQANNINAKAEQLSLKKLSVNGTLSTNATSRNSLAIKLNQLDLAQQQVAQATINFNGSWLKHRAKVQLTSNQGSVQLALNGGYRQQQWLGQLTQANIDAILGRWAITKPLAIGVNVKNQQLKLDKHCWLQLASPTTEQVGIAPSLCLNQPSTIGTTGRLNLGLNNFNISQLAPLLEQSNLQGLVQLSATASWQPNTAPRIDATLSSPQGQINVETPQGEFISHYQQLLVKLTANSQQNTLHVAVNSPEIGSILLDASATRLKPNAPLQGKLKLAQINLAPFKPFLPNVETLTGIINSQTTIGGTLDAPLLFGDIKLKQGHITGASLPTNIDKLTANIALSGNKADIDSNFMLGQGAGKVTGQLQWQPELSGDFTISGSQMVVEPTSDLSITFSPNININYTNALLAIGGNVSIDQGKVKINNLPQSAVSLSDDVIVISDAPPVEPPANKLALALDIDVLIKENFNIDAFGLTSSLAGQLKLAQSIKAPLTGHGELNLINAKYKAMGQHLDIRQGKMLFTGALNQPYLDIEAIREPDLTQDDVIAGINITGPAKRPSLTIFSEPAMSQQEAISYLLRGRQINSEDSTTGESMLIGMLLSSGIEGSGDLVNDIGNSVGISDMSFNTKGSGDDTAVEVSGYIAPNVELRYAVGVFDSQPELTIRYQLLPKLFVDIIKGTDEALDLLYLFDFD